MKDNIENLIKYRIDRAFYTLREAETLIENKFWNASINRIYYACFYAVSGLLLMKGLDTSHTKEFAKCLDSIMYKQVLYQKI